MPPQRPNQTAAPRAKESRAPRRKPSLWKLALGTTWGKLGLLALALYLAYLIAPDPVIRLYRDIQRGLLQAFGYALAPAALWVLAFLITLRWRPWLLFRRWRLFLGSALLLAGVMGTLSFLTAPSNSSMAGHSLGGDLGLLVRGDLPVVDVFQVLLFLALGLWIVAPRWFPWAVRTGFRWIEWGVDGLGVTLALLPRGARALVALYRRYPLHRPIGQGVRGAAQGGVVLRRAIPKKTAPGGSPPAKSATETLPAPSSPGTDEPPRQATAIREKAPSAVAPGDRPDWDLPPLSRFQKGNPPVIDHSETRATARLIESALEQFGIEVEVTQIRPGPTVTLYGLVPGWVRRLRDVRERDDEGSVIRDEYGKTVVSQVEERTRIKVDTILAREKDLALALAAPSLRFQAPVPGESVVGLEVPNKRSSLVTLRSVMESEAFTSILDKGGLPLALGQGPGGEALAVDLLQMPHLLIAGATGSGKSVCMNAFIASIISHWSPLNLRLVLVDPKRVELTPYNGVPHLATKVIVDPERMVRILKGAVQEMLRRYKFMETVAARNIQTYNQTASPQDRMPYLVICIDELADLMLASPYDAEHTLCRLAQLGRATGIHLIVATQRPSVDVVTGLIKANFPSRLSFAVASQVDSRTILDSAGAERLLGKGDMLFLALDAPKPKRIQGAFVSDREIQDLVRFWRAQNGPMPPPLPLEELAEEAAKEGGQDNLERGSHDDELLDKAVELASRYSHLSTSLLQRKLQIGYPRAAKLMDLLEAEGVVGPQEPGGRARPVLHRASSTTPPGDLAKEE